MARAFAKAQFAKARNAALVAVLIAAACTPVYRNHGYIPAEDELSQVAVGQDTKETVATTVGRPSVEGLLNDNGWFYVQSRFKTIGPRQPQEIERQVVAITFDDQDRVANVERFGLEKGEVVAISRRITSTSIKQIGLIQQLLGSLGRLRADQLLQ
ncbi:MAG: cell envelope protein SmpA [Rhodobacteraceae bacterium PARR1]|nr:MAG: cell envelope protein SmpA [Rhodobacteraceae bacterium PARR1]